MKRLVWAAALLAAITLAVLAAAAWLLGTESGLRWAVARAQQASGGTLEIEGARGVLAGAVRIERLSYAGDGFRLEARELGAAADLLALLGGRLVIAPLRAAALEITLAEEGARAGAGAAPLPPVLPLGVRVADVAIERVTVQRGAERYALREVRLQHAEIGTTRPASISAAGSFRRPDERFPASGRIELGGTLERLETSLALNAAGVDAEARARLEPFGPRPVRTLEVRAGPIDLARFDPGWPRTALTLTLKGAASREQALAGTAALTNTAPGPLDQGRLPVLGVQAQFASADFTRASLEALRIALSGGGTLQGRGELSAERASATLQARSIDLHALRSTLRRTELQGELAVVAAAEAQSVEGTLAQQGMRLSAQVLRKGETLDIRSLRALADGGELSGSATLKLAAPFAFQASLRLARVDPAAFGDYPEGSLNGTLSADGHLGGERQIDALWTLADSTLLGRPIASRGNARVAGTRVSRADAQASFGTASASARGAFGAAGDALAWTLEVPQLEEFVPAVAGSLQASATFTGSLDQPQVAASALAERLRLPGGLTLDALRATLDGQASRHEIRISARRPESELDARLRGGWAGEAWAGVLERLEIAGAYPLRLLAPVPLEIARRRVELGSIEAALGEGRLLMREVKWSGERLSSSGRFDGLPAAWLLLAAGMDARVRSTVLLDGQWSLASTPELNGTISLRRSSGDLALANGTPVELGLRSASLDARFDAGRLSAKANVETRFGTAALHGELAPVPQASGLGFAAASPLAFEARMDFARLRSISQPLLAQARLDGRISASLRGSGTLGETRLHGTLNGEAISFDFPPYGVYLKDGVLRAALEGDRLRIEEFSIQGREGRFVASGTLPLRLGDAPAQLDWSAERFAVLDRPDMRLVVSGKGEARVEAKRLSLAGELRAERGYLEFEQERLPQLGEDVVIVGRPRAAEAQARLPVRLDLQLDLGENLALRGRGLEGKLAGRVRVATTEKGELRAYGELRAVNATYRAYGQRLEVDPGTLLFDGPIDNPSLQITAWRRNQAVEAGVQITGSMQAPRVQLVSEPPVPEGERLSWLVLGRPPADASQADLGLLQAAAGAALSGGGTPADLRIARAVGLDEIALRGTGELQNQAVAIGKRVSERLYLSYERGLGIVATNLVKLDYALGRRWSLRAESGTTTSAWGLFYRFSWD